MEYTVECTLYFRLLYSVQCLCLSNDVQESLLEPVFVVAVCSCWFCNSILCGQSIGEHAELLDIYVASAHGWTRAIVNSRQ